MSFADNHVAACDAAKIKNAVLAESDPSTVIEAINEDGTTVKINP
jgi:hypothetical protein